MGTWRKYQVKIKVGIGVMFLEAKEFQGLPATHQKLREMHGIDPHNSKKETTLIAP